MTANESVQPPRMATWLLETLGASPANESLLGDLVEEYQQRRSASWYWKQVFGAILVSAFQHARSHKLATLQAVALGWTATELTAFAAASVLFAAGVRFPFLTWTQYPATAALCFATFCGCAAIGGWLVARLQSAHRAPIVLSYIAVSLVVVTAVIPWDYQLVSRDVFLSFLPFQLAFGFVGMPLGIAFGASLAGGKQRSVA